MPSQTATLLVTDLVGSTELRARLAEEEADELHRPELRDLVPGLDPPLRSDPGGSRKVPGPLKGQG